MDKSASFEVSVEFLDKVSLAEVGEDYNNPLLSFVQLVFTDDKPNLNNQGVKQAEFDNLLTSMQYMPIKVNFDPIIKVQGHSNADVVGVIKSGKKDGDKLVAFGALFKEEFPDVIDYFKQTVSDGGQIDFSWEIMYKDAEVVDGVEWLKGTTTKAITAVANPAYGGRTPLLSISSTELLEAINKELEERGVANE